MLISLTSARASRLLDFCLKSKFGYNVNSQSKGLGGSAGQRHSPVPTLGYQLLCGVSTSLFIPIFILHLVGFARAAHANLKPTYL